MNQRKIKRAVLILTMTMVFSSGCSSRAQSSDEPAHITVQIIDKSPPTISVTDKTIEEGETVKLSECYSVEDAVTEKPEATVTCDSEAVTIDRKKDTASFENAGEFNFSVISVDETGNESKSSFKITVNKKVGPTPEPTPESTPEPEQHATASNSSQSFSSTSQSQTQTAQPSQQQPAAIEQPSQSQSSAQPVTKYFMFSDGYDMTSAGPACTAEFGNYGSGTKSCNPIIGDDGLYKGYVFQYNP